MAPDGIVGPIDIAANGLVGFLASVEGGPPHGFGFQALRCLVPAFAGAG